MDEQSINEIPEKDAKRIVDVGGIKMEVDLRFARKVDYFHVGDPVKPLMKKSGYNERDHVVYPGIIVGFEEFEKLPTIVVAYLHKDYSEASLRFKYINEETKDLEIIHQTGTDRIINKKTAVEAMNQKIMEKEKELAGLKMKRDFFLQNFGEYFEAKAEESVEEKGGV